MSLFLHLIFINEAVSELAKNAAAGGCKKYDAIGLAFRRHFSWPQLTKILPKFAQEVASK